MAALGGLSPRMRARVQKIVLKVKLSFSETSQVPGAAGDTVRIFLLICQKDKEKKKKKKKKTDCCSALGQQPQGGLEGSWPGLSALRWGIPPRGRASHGFPGPWGPV